MSSDVDGHGNMTIKQTIMRFNEVSQNRRIFPTPENKGDEIMGNKENNKEGNLNNEAIRNLKELTKIVNNFIDCIEKDNEASTRNTKTDNSYSNPCEHCNKRDDKDSSDKHYEDEDINDELKDFMNHIEEISGGHAKLIPIVPGSKSFEEFLESMCNNCDSDGQCHGCCDECKDDDTDEDDDEFISRIDHIEHTVDLIMKRLNFIVDLIHSDQMARSAIEIPSDTLEYKPGASKKRVKKLEKRLNDANHRIDELQAEIKMIKKKLK